MTPEETNLKSTNIKKEDHSQALPKQTTNIDIKPQIETPIDHTTTSDIVSHHDVMVDDHDLEYYLNTGASAANSGIPTQSHVTGRGLVSFLSSEEEEEEAAMHAPISFTTSSSVMDEDDLYLVKNTLKTDYEEETIKFEFDYFPKDIIHNFAITLYRMPIATVKHIALKNNVTIIDPKLKKGKRMTDDHRKEYLIFEIGKKVVGVAVKHFLSELDREDMRSALRDLLRTPSVTEILESAKHKEIEPEHTLNMKTVHTLKKSGLRSNFKLLFERMGAEVLLDALSDPTLILFLQALEINEIDTTHSNLVDAILEEVFLYGAKEVLGKCKKSILREAAEAAQYEAKKQVFEASPTKEMLSEVILVDEFPHVAEDLLTKLRKKKPSLFEGEGKSKKRTSDGAFKVDEEDELYHSPTMFVSEFGSPGKNQKKRGRKRVINTEGERPQIDRGITFNDLKDKYLVQELILFAQSKGIKYVGVKKTDLCESIIKYLNGELVPTVKKRGRGRPPKKRKENDEEDEDDLDDENHNDEMESAEE